jgi:hypothetical protein
MDILFKAAKDTSYLLFLIIFPITINICISSDAPAAGAIPLYYWRLLDQERYIQRSDMEQLNWREIRRLRQLNRSANQEPKLFVLSILETVDKIGRSRFADKRVPDRTIAIVRDPDGAISRLSGMSETGDRIHIPADQDLIGRYLLGALIPLGKMDVDGDGIAETVHVCCNHLVAHYKNGGKMGSNPAVFFNDGDSMPFEIGPVVDTAKSKFGGGTQSPHRVYEMMVKYMNKPLGGVRVTVIAMGSRWEKTVVTDDEGKFEIMPTDDRLSGHEWQQYLYVAAHHDREKKAYYVATLPTVVYKNRPEWRSKAMGFTCWAIVAATVGLLMTLGYVRRKSLENKRTLIIFENRKIKEDRL